MEKEIDPRDFQPALPLPGEYTLEQIRSSLVTLRIDQAPAGELYNYAFGDCERFIRTLALIADAPGRLLEVGSNPYFTTVLLKAFRPQYELFGINYFGPGLGELVRNQVAYDGLDGEVKRYQLDSLHLNLEVEGTPYADEHFDVVLFCEVLEHMTNNPMTALLELSRITRTGGHVVLTTPNVARLENVVAFCEGRNIYDPYSGYGPYGRHNREYTRHELHLLMQHCGFVPEVSYTANVGPDHPVERLGGDVIRRIVAATPNREYDLGQYLFTRWRKVSAPEKRLPSWLYRSYPSEQLV